MRKAFAAIATCCLISATVACNKSAPKAPINNDIKPVPQDNNRTEVTWTLNFLSKCDESVSEDQCVGKFGFSVLTDGHYQIGPGPTGEVRSGALTAEEFAALNAAMATALANAGSTADGHLEIEQITSEETVTLAKGSSQPDTLLKASGTDLTYRVGTSDEAKKLLTVLRELATKYYLLPFPDSCMDGASSLQTLVASMKGCTVNTDCSYVDAGYNLLDVGSTDFLATDDCSLVRPMVAGNTSMLKTNQAKLQELLGQVQGSCGERYMRLECSYTGFNLTGKPPVCQQGVCQATTP